MNTKILLASIATATTLAAPAAFASEIYGALENPAASPTIVSALPVNDAFSGSGTLYGFENTTVRGDSMTVAETGPRGTFGRGELYGFERDTDRVAQMPAMASRGTATATLAGGELYGFENGRGAVAASLTFDAQPVAGQGRGALYGFEGGSIAQAGQPVDGGMTVATVESRGELYGFSNGELAE